VIVRMRRAPKGLRLSALPVKHRSHELADDAGEAFAVADHTVKVGAGVPRHSRSKTM